MFGCRIGSRGRDCRCEWARHRCIAHTGRLSCRSGDHCRCWCDTAFTAADADRRRSHRRRRSVSCCRRRNGAGRSRCGLPPLHLGLTRPLYMPRRLSLSLPLSLPLSRALPYALSRAGNAARLTTYTWNSPGRAQPYTRIRTRRRSCRRARTIALRRSFCLPSATSVRLLDVEHMCKSKEHAGLASRQYTARISLKLPLSTSWRRARKRTYTDI